NPITRLTSFFTDREVGVTTATDEPALGAAVEALRGKIAREPKEGSITFEGAKPVAVQPQPGQQLDADAARKAIVDGWLDGRVELQVTNTPARTTAEGVNIALEQLAKPAVSGPVVVHGEGKDATLSPEAIGAALLFEPAEGGGLTLKVDQAKIVAAAQPQL